MIPETFSPVAIDGFKDYTGFWQAAPQKSIDYGLANLWGWASYYGLEWRMADNLCWIRQTKSEPKLWAPVGDWEKIDWSKASPLAEGATMIRVPQKLAAILEQALPGRVEITPCREHDEYLYSVDDMANLPGNRFHKKRNHVNGYIKAYGEPEYHVLDDMAIDEVLALEDEWCQWHECAGSPSLLAENEAINRVLAHWDDIPGLVGGCIYHEGSMIAFSVGEKLNGEALGVHYEKGRHGYRGIYQVMNSYFAKNAGPGVTILNRAQDLGEEGLRQAKMTYLPVDFLYKFDVTIKPL